jgi:hypothetical protein
MATTRLARPGAVRARARSRGSGAGVEQAARVGRPKSRAGARGAVRCRLGRNGCGPRSEAEAHEGENKFFFLFFNSFSRFSKSSSFKPIFEQENGIFWKWPENESCLEFNSQQLLLRDQLKILNRF